MNTKYITVVALFWGLAVLICVGSLAGCKKEEVIKEIDYNPVELSATTYGSLEEKTVILNGNIARLNDVPTEDHGFIIQKIEQNVNDEKEIVVSLGNKVAVGDVSLKYQHNSNFELGDSFRFTLYVKTKNGFYRSKSSVFEVDGTSLNLWEGKSVPNDNKITIEGDFRFVPDKAKLFCNSQYQQETVLSYEIASDKKSLTFVFPKSDNFYHGNNVNVFLRNDNKGVAIDRLIAKIQVLGVIHAPTKTKMYLNEPLQISGIAIGTEGWRLSAPFYILLNGKKVEYKSQILLYEIEGLKGEKIELGYDNEVESVIFKDSITIIKPNGNDIRFEKSVIHSPSLMKMNGINMYTYIMEPEKATYYLGKHAISHYFNSTYGDPQTYAVRNVPDGVYDFSYSSPFYSVTSTDKVEVRNLQWDTPVNNSRYIGETFTITGNFIDGHSYSVVGNGIGEYPVAKEGKINFTLPSYVVGETEIQIGYSVNINYNENHFAAKKQKLYVKDFQVSSISPMKGYPGDIITIKGKGLSPLQTTLGGAYVHCFYRSPDEVRFMVPAFSPKGQAPIVMQINATRVKYKDLFETL